MQESKMLYHGQMSRLLETVITGLSFYAVTYIYILPYLVFAKENMNRTFEAVKHQSLYQQLHHEQIDKEKRKKKKHTLLSISGAISFHSKVGQKPQTNKKHLTLKSMHFLQGSTYLLSIDN